MDFFSCIKVDDFELIKFENPFKAIARPIFGYLSRHFNIKTLAIFWTLLHLMVAVILTINTSIPIFILAAFLNGCSMGGSIGARMVLVIELLGEQLLVRNCRLSSFLRKNFQRPYLVLENMFIAPLGFLIPQLLVSFADSLNNPSLTFCPAIIAALINCALIGKIYKEDVLKKQSI